ncbi:unnamed protein product [Brassica oleracea var. botrytis]
MASTPGVSWVNFSVLWLKLILMSVNGCSECNVTVVIKREDSVRH